MNPLKIVALTINLSCILSIYLAQRYTAEVQVPEGMGGRVGIGTDNADTKFQIEGQDVVLKGRGTSASIKIRNTEYSEEITGYGFIEHDAYDDVLLGATRSDDPVNLGFLRTYAGGTEKVTLASNGSAGIGMNPSSKLSVNGDLRIGPNENFYVPGIKANWGLRSNCRLLQEYDAALDENFAKIVHWGHARGFRFYAHVNYNDDHPAKVAEITRFGAISGTSDRRLKENIQPVSDARIKIAAINGVTFSWKGDDQQKKTAGFIAQDVYEVIPEAVNKPANPEETWTMNISR